MSLNRQPFLDVACKKLSYISSRDVESRSCSASICTNLSITLTHPRTWEHCNWSVSVRKSQNISERESQNSLGRRQKIPPTVVTAGGHAIFLSFLYGTFRRKIRTATTAWLVASPGARDNRDDDPQSSQINEKKNSPQNLHNIYE